MSGEIPKWPLSKAESVFLETPSPLAASVTVRFNGAIQSSRITSPGWGGLCITIFFSLMIIEIIYISRVIFLVEAPA